MQIESVWRKIWGKTFADYDLPLGQVPEGLGYDTWAYPEGWKDTSKRGTYSPKRTMSVTGGVLDIWPHSENGKTYVGALLPVLAPGPRPYGSGVLAGRFSVRLKATRSRSFKAIGILLWPDGDVGNLIGGETDWGESNLDGGTVRAFAHHAADNGTQEQFMSNATYDTWHTYTTQWRPGLLEFFLDGALVGKSVTHVPTLPMHPVLQVETLLDKTIPILLTDSAHVSVSEMTVYAHVPQLEGGEAWLPEPGEYLIRTLNEDGTVGELAASASV